jgi:hypothetical protein
MLLCSEESGPSKSRTVSMTKADMKTAAMFLFLLVNATWVFFAYQPHVIGVIPRLIAIVVAVGALLGNVAIYGSLRLARKLLSETKISN